MQTGGGRRSSSTSSSVLGGIPSSLEGGGGAEDGLIAYSNGEGVGGGDAASWEGEGGALYHDGHYRGGHGHSLGGGDHAEFDSSAPASPLSYSTGGRHHGSSIALPYDQQQLLQQQQQLQFDGRFSDAGGSGGTSVASSPRYHPTQPTSIAADGEYDGRGVAAGGVAQNNTGESSWHGGMVAQQQSSSRPSSMRIVGSVTVEVGAAPL